MEGRGVTAQPSSSPEAEHADAQSPPGDAARAGGMVPIGSTPESVVIPEPGLVPGSEPVPEPEAEPVPEAEAVPVPEPLPVPGTAGAAGAWSSGPPGAEPPGETGPEAGDAPMARVRVDRR